MKRVGGDASDARGGAGGDANDVMASGGGCSV